MDKLRKLFKGKNKNTITNLAVAATIGILLLVMNGEFFGEKEENAEVRVLPEEAGNSIETISRQIPSTHEGILEARLEEAFSHVQGVGEVRVMLTLAHGREIVIAEDILLNESNTSEVDASGGTREVSTTSLNSNKIIIGGSGGHQPLILKEIEPQVEGVIIIAEGGDNVTVREALINATRTVLGIDAHRVQVLQMANQSSVN